MVVQKPDGGGPAPPLAEEVDPAPHVGDGQRQVGLAHRLRPPEVPSGQLHGGRQAVLRRQAVGAHLPDLSVYAIPGRQPLNQVDIRCPVPQGLFYKLFYNHVLPPQPPNTRWISSAVVTPLSTRRRQSSIIGRNPEEAMAASSFSRERL